MYNIFYFVLLFVLLSSANFSSLLYAQKSAGSFEKPNISFAQYHYIIMSMFKGVPMAHIDVCTHLNKEKYKKQTKEKHLKDNLIYNCQSYIRTGE